MSGHSKWAKIKRDKAATDGKRAKVFTKIQKEIMVAVKLGGPNPAFNARLKGAIIYARSENMPKDRIESAIKKADSAGDTSNYAEMRYEGRMPGGVAIIVETLTDNKNRTASNVRAAFTKCNSTLAETGSITFLFDKIGTIGYEGSKANADEIFEVALNAGAQDVESTDEWHSITTDPSDFAAVRDALIEKYGDPDEAKIIWKAKDPAVCDDVEKAERIMKLIDKLEDDDDVQDVYHNIEFTDEVMEKLGM